MIGLDRVPSDRPVMLLPNHQNALLDPLLVAAFAKAKRPYFLTRSDVFQGRILRTVFDALRMIPIYRLRDGRDTLHRNQEIFDRSSALLAKGEHLLLFPEANHHLNRRVRPLSKGFTRIVIHTLSQHPETPLLLLPVGINYQQAEGFPDRVSFIFGEVIEARGLYDETDLAGSSKRMKAAVASQLKELTTHIESEEDYARLADELAAENTDFLHPAAINAYLKGDSEELPKVPGRSGIAYELWDGIFSLLNLPVRLPWGWIARNKVWEPEFLSTFRYCYSLLAFPVYFGLLTGLLSWWLGGPYAIGITLALFTHNLLYVKFR